MSNETSSQLNLVERIKAAQETLPVSRREIGECLSNFAEVDNSNGMRELFDAYLSWETRACADTETPEQTRQRSLKNFDILAQIMDELAIVDGSEYLAARRVVDGENTIGNTTLVFRNALDHLPEGTDQAVDIDPDIDTGQNL